MNYSDKNIRELKNMCKENGIKGYSKKKKSELIELLLTFQKKDGFSKTSTALTIRQDSINKIEIHSSYKMNSIEVKETTLPESSKELDESTNINKEERD